MEYPSCPFVKELTRICCRFRPGHILLLFLALSVSVTATELQVPYTAYPGHGRDSDLLNILKVYPSISGTLLDDCRLCHRGNLPEKPHINHCDACHAKPADSSFTDTLNAYGLAYLRQGRDVNAIRKIQNLDSDGDSVSNQREILMNSFPGEKESMPKQAEMPRMILTHSKLENLPVFKQFIFMNAPKQTDYYAKYQGWLVEDILRAAGVVPGKYTGITVISQDGFRKDFSVSDIRRQFPSAAFFYDPGIQSGEGTCPPVVKYPGKLPKGVEKGKKLPGPFRLMVAAVRDGIELIPRPHGVKGPLRGENGYRLIIPQHSPSEPDQSETRSNPDCPYPYHPEYDHNAAVCGRNVIAIQVHPTPSGLREPDWHRMADALFFKRDILIFGNIPKTSDQSSVH